MTTDAALADSGFGPVMALLDPAKGLSASYARFYYLNAVFELFLSPTSESSFIVKRRVQVGDSKFPIASDIFSKLQKVYDRLRGEAVCRPYEKPLLLFHIRAQHALARVSAFPRVPFGGERYYRLTDLLYSRYYRL